MSEFCQSAHLFVVHGEEGPEPEERRRPQLVQHRRLGEPFPGPGLFSSSRLRALLRLGRRVLNLCRRAP